MYEKKSRQINEGINSVGIVHSSHLFLSTFWNMHLGRNHKSLNLSAKELYTGVCSKTHTLL